MTAHFRALALLTTTTCLLAVVFGGAHAQAMEPGQPFGRFLAEQLEYRTGDGESGVNWDAEAWIGNDDHKAWFKTEGEKPTDGKLEKGEVQALYVRRISDFFDAQVGVRYDVKPEPSRGFAVLGVQGLAPYFIEIDAAVFLSHEGEASARFKAEYDLPITQRLVLQPKLEVNAALQDVPDRHVGQGFNNVELGLRLRYELVREFAPYVGVNWDRKLGETADFARRDGERTATLSLVAGVRFWF